MKFAAMCLLVSLLFAGCLAEVDTAHDEVASADSQLSSSLDYSYVSRTDASATGPLALRRANAKPSFFNPSYGWATLPKVVRARDASFSEAQFAALLALPYAGHEQEVVALVGTRDVSSLFGEPSVEVVELYWPRESVMIADVQQRDALYQLKTPQQLRLVNERDYTAGPLALDTSATTDPDLTQHEVEAGALFYGAISIECHVFLGVQKCKAPTAATVRAVFESAP